MCLFGAGVCPPPAADEAFESEVQNLKASIKKRTELYEAEERALRVMLEGEQEEERKREMEKKLKKEREKLLQQKRDMDSKLFGDPGNIQNVDAHCLGEADLLLKSRNVLLHLCNNFGEGIVTLKVFIFISVANKLKVTVPQNVYLCSSSMSTQELIYWI